MQETSDGREYFVTLPFKVRLTDCTSYYKVPHIFYTGFNLQNKTDSQKQVYKYSSLQTGDSNLIYWYCRKNN